ncbi:polysaccharide biosynthesis/export family protein [uncultured Dokdonia sp.]|uniref:polysaccharide biosynthesis/export family protein n=1 Tax=uncultured Dokdonia sp. TaxID=575653 RepID=UPI00260BBD8B|nr:polysaccharide biosynthesis/export family protein [uncultured Dokdonia sp.]
MKTDIKIPKAHHKDVSVHYRRFLKITFAISLVLFIVSCKAPKDIVYFQESENLEQITSGSHFIATYKPHDIISIKVSAPDAETAIPFNAGTVSSSSESGALTASTTTSRPSYLIDTNGMIEFPVLGELKVGGRSSAEVKAMIKDKLTEYINNPIVSVRLENFKITILGEVQSPGAITINNERITLIEALGLAGDLGIQGKRTNITVIREENSKQVIHKVDLTSKDIFSSPVYYLAQNDVVYVEPNASKAKSSKNSNWPRVLTSVTSVLGIIISVIAITQ